MEVLAAFNSKNELIDIFDANNKPDEIADKLISGGLIDEYLDEIEYSIDGRYCTNDFDIYETIEFSADNGRFTVEIRKYEVK